MVPEKILESEGFASILRSRKSTENVSCVLFFNTAGLARDSRFSR